LGLSVKNLLGDRDATSEWYTPPQFIQLVRQMLGEINLDTASNPIAQDSIQADRFYSKEENGLVLP